jgi:3-oxoacyl-[acyl-carrier protein] reductase
MSVELTDAVALVTGGSRGIGRACAVALAAAGADVVVGYTRSEEAAAETARAVEEHGRRAVTVRADVSRAEEVEALFGELRDNFGRLHILVNNAGMSHDGLVGVLDVDDWDRVLAVNLRGPFLCTRAALPFMVPQRRGKIVNVGSVAAHRTRPGQAVYAASKGGLAAFTRACAVELAPRGIQVNAVLPGLVATDMTARLRRRSGDALREAIPAGRFTEPEEVAAAVVFLASRQADAITGQELVVDGGLCVS